MRHVSLLAIGLLIAPCYSFAQEPSDCMGTESEIDPATGKVLSERCVRYSEYPDYFLKKARLRTIAKQGLAGRKRTAYVLELLQDEDWDVRAEAAKTLGLIGETSAIPDLIAIIGERDWQLTFETMTSLRNLKAAQAEDILQNIAVAYWQPGIRAAARRLLDGIPEPKTPGRDWPYRSPIAAHCNGADGGKVVASGKSLASHPDLAHAALAEKIASVKGGRLVAYDAGEFGGMLEFQPTAGAPTQLIRGEAVVAVLVSGKSIFALTGTPHLGSDDGFIYKVEPAADGSWVAQIIWRLPGAPLAVGYTPGGVMGISTNYGDVIFRSDSGMEWISCPPRE